MDAVTYKPGDLVTVRRYREDRLTWHATGRVIRVGETGFTLAQPNGNRSALAHEPGGPVRQVVDVLPEVAQ